MDVRSHPAWLASAFRLVPAGALLGIVACAGTPATAPAAPPAAAPAQPPPTAPSQPAPAPAAAQTVYEKEYAAHNYSTLPISTKKPKYGGVHNLVGSSSNPVPNFNPFGGYQSELTIPCDSLLGQDLNRSSQLDPAKKTNADRLTVIPVLAKEWKQESETSYLLKLQEGVKFFNLPPVNGREFTSEDAKLSIETYRASPAWSSLFEFVDKIDTPDKYTMRLTTKVPFAPMINYLSWPHMMMMPKELIDNKDLMKTDLICTGPFMKGDYQPNVSITYQRNPNYWLRDRKNPENQLPYLDGVNITRILDFNAQKAAFRTGQVDSIRPEVPSQMAEIMKTNPNTVYQVAPPSPTGQHHLAMRLDQKPYSDVRVRRALSLALDRKKMWESVGEGFWGAAIPVAFYDLGLERPPSLDSLGPWYKYDPAQAKKLMQESGYGDGFKAQVMSFWPSGPYVDMLQLIQAQWKQNLGVELTISTPDRNAFLDAVFGKKWEGFAYTFFVLGSGSSSDPDDFTYGMHNSKSSRNFWGYSNPKMDDLTLQQRSVFDAKKRQDLVKQIMDLELDEVVRIWVAGTWQFEAWQPYVQEASHNIVFWYGPAAGASQIKSVWLDK